MAQRAAKRLVIDADVARATGGEEAVHPTAKSCYRFLMTMRSSTSHKVAMTPELRDEWKKHQSVFAQTWLTSMIARRRFAFVNPRAQDELLQQITDVMADEHKNQIVGKDFHLLEAALVTDRTIVSMDERVRALLKNAAQGVVEIRSVVWINPDRDEERSIDWLQRGAAMDKERQLGYTERN